MWSSSSNFIKHLSCTLISRHFLILSRRHRRPIARRFFPSNSFPLFFTIYEPRKLTKPTWLSPNISLSASLSSLASSETSPYLSVDIRCHKDNVDMLSEALLCFGASSTTIDEKDADESSDEESFNPIKVTDGLWIVPEWKTAPDLQATNIILNPGLAFGTGEHATTKLCLLLLHGLIEGGELFLDYGTGSGILAIVALKIGAAFSVGIDIDPQAIASARQNAALNDIGPEQMRLHSVPETTSTGVKNSCGIAEAENSNNTEVMPETEKFDIVVANILLNPLLDLAENIVSYAKPGAVVGLSGILSEQLPVIMERYSRYLEGIACSVRKFQFSHQVVPCASEFQYETLSISGHEHF
ncbi:hypothetical protein TIFTF001_023612 [Ficus carica]|uniref:ETFB lysine methyltransferase n=1 Tax=Ficus carica TaxID=3494 RepID=A0AA88AF35_FICCA|nr:hypothetical protein TIFTF001_023612 [Ficus carica]